MRAMSVNTATTRQNLDSAVQRLARDTADYTLRRAHGEITVRLRFVDGVAVQWAVFLEETYKTGREPGTGDSSQDERSARFRT